MAGVQDMQISRESMRIIRHQIEYHFYNSVPVPLFINESKQR
jgi:hypothetical protein